MTKEDAQQQGRAVSFHSRDAPFLVADKSYSQQYAGLYFSRLTIMKKRAMQSADRKWGVCESAFSSPLGASAAGQHQESAKRVDRLLDIEPGVLCYVS